MDVSGSTLQQSPTTPRTQDSPSEPDKKDPLKIRLRRRLTADIDPKHADIVLIGCFFCAGLIESVTFSVYRCFVGGQTGNTIFICLGISGQSQSEPSFAWTKALLSLVAFLLGALFFETFHRKFRPLKRWVVFSSFVLQTALIIVAASLVTTGVVSHDAVNIKKMEAWDRYIRSGEVFPWLDFLPIGLLAFQSAGQVVASRALRRPALSTIVAGTLYVDLMSNMHLLSAGVFADPERNRTAASVLSLISGALVGGFLAKSWLGFLGALWIAAFLKSLIVFAWFLWKPETSAQEDDEERRE